MKLDGKRGIKDDWPEYFKGGVIRCLGCGANSDGYRFERFHSFMIPHYYGCHGGAGVIRTCFEWR